jgi:hypothetical protein
MARRGWKPPAPAPCSSTPPATAATILATGADRVPLADAPEAPMVLPPHANIRGRAYYTPEEPLCLLTPPSTN